MAYISYRDVPIFFGGSNTDTLPVPHGKISSAGSTGVLATQASLNYTPNIAATRLLGDNVTKDNFTLAGAPNQTLSFSCFLDGAGWDKTSSSAFGKSFNPTGFTGDIGNKGATFKIGDPNSGISGSGAFLTSFSYTVTPYQPIQVQADFVIYNPIRQGIQSFGGSGIASGDGNIGSVPVTRDIAPEEIAHGAYSTIVGTSPSSQHHTGAAIAQQDIVESIGYQYQVNRLPIYKIGELCISEVEYVTANQSLAIRGDNIGQIVPMTGDQPGPIEIALKDSLSNTHLSGSIDGIITAQNLSISAGDVLRGDVTITQPLK